MRILKFGFFLIFLLGIFASNAHADFLDVNEDNQFYESISWMQENNIVVGYKDGTFKPDKEITRAEFLKIIYESLGVDSREAVFYDLRATDVTGLEWFYPYVRKAYYEGIVSGYPDGSFGPNLPINRAEAMKIVMNAFFTEEMVLTEYGAGDDYDSCFALESDQVTDVEAWYWPYVYVADNYCVLPLEMLQENGEDGFFNAGAFLTRGEMAELVYRSSVVDKNGFEIFDEDLDPATVLDENEFSFVGLEIGDEVVGMTVTSILAGSGFQEASAFDFEIQFQGPVTLSGDFHFPDEGRFTEKACFYLDDASYKKIPSVDNSNDEDRWFCFRNQEFAKEEFGPSLKGGPASISIDELFYVAQDVRDFNTVNLISVVQDDRNPAACTDLPIELEDGSLQYPIDPEYAHLSYLGQLFTGAWCMGDRFRELPMINGDNYTYESIVNLKEDPDAELVDVLHSIGYFCASSIGDIPTCRDWHLTESVPFTWLLPLEMYADKIEQDTCFGCY